jgi:hypothetical protein
VSTPRRGLLVQTRSQRCLFAPRASLIKPRARITSSDDDEEASMSKRARKRRDRGKKAANHGKKPNT